MKTQKYVIQQIAFNVFRISLYGIATITALCIIFARSDNVKRAFIETNAYKRFVPSSIHEAVKLDQSAATAPMKDENVQQIIAASFPPTTLQANTEEVINSFYAWLNGLTPKPDFTVDFSTNIEQMANNLSAYAMRRLQMQPVCKVDPESIDPFTATCRPNNFDYVSEKAALAQAIKDNNGILAKTKLTADDLPRGSKGKTFVEQYWYAPKLFAFMQYVPWILFVVACSSAIIVVALDRRKHEATYRIGTNTVSASVFLIVSPLFYIYILPHFIPSLAISTNSNGGGGAVVGDVVNKISLDFSNQLIFVSGMMVLVGIMIILLERATRPKSKYIKAEKKSGLTSSEKRRVKKPNSKPVLSESTVPIQTSEGKKLSSKYQKDKRYRKIPKKEYE